MNREEAMAILAAITAVAKEINLSEAWDSIQAAFRDKHIGDAPPHRADLDIKEEQQASIRRRFGDST